MDRKEYFKAYYEANKDKIKAYREANKDKIAKQNKAYREANKDKIAKQMKAYYKSNKKYFKAYKKELISRVLSELYTENNNQTIPISAKSKHNSSYTSQEKA